MMKKPEPARSSRSERDDRGGFEREPRERNERKGDGTRSKKHQRDARMVRLFLSVGKKDRVSKGDIVGSIASLANISSSEIGIIDVYDKFSFVEVNGESLNDVLSNVNGNKIKGRKVNVEIAKD